MTLSALQHLLRAAQALAEDRAFLVLGPASLHASFPDLGEPDAPLASTYDADLCPEPFDDLAAPVTQLYRDDRLVVVHLHDEPHRDPRILCSG